MGHTGLLSHQVRMAGFEPAVSCFRNTRSARLSHILICKRPARIELAFSAWQADGLPLHHGRKMHHYQIVKDQNQEHRAGIEPASPRYDGGILPLEDQCLCSFSGTGENRTHIVRFKRPMHYLVCHNPMCFFALSDRRGRNRTFDPRLIRTPLLPMGYTPW